LVTAGGLSLNFNQPIEKKKERGGGKVRTNPPAVDHRKPQRKEKEGKGKRKEGARTELILHAMFSMNGKTIIKERTGKRKEGGEKGKKKVSVQGRLL